MGSERIVHHFTVDVEEYFHPTALAELISEEEWDALPRRSPALIDQLLARLEANGVRCTFFVLGWLARREPEMVKRIADSGHEIASHGWGHKKVTELSPEAFREDIKRSRGLLESLTGKEVMGYRAPSFSIIPGVEWALDALLEEGYRYDSSTFPVRIHPGYGYPDANPRPHLIDRPSGSLFEFPPTTLKVAGLRLPAAGGAYLRFFPLGLIRSGLRAAEKEGVPGTFYVHPWEWDPEMPSIDAPALTRLRMTRGIRQVSGKLERLMGGFRFGPIQDTVAKMAIRGTTER